MKKCFDEVIEFNTEQKLFYEVFSRGLQQQNILVVITDPLLMEGLVSFLRERRAKILKNTAEGRYGFFILTEFSEDTDMTAVSGICSIGFSSELCPTLCIPDDKAYFRIALTRETMAGDYWRSPDPDRRSATWPTIGFMPLNEQLKPLFLNTFLIADREIDMECPWLNRSVVDKNFIRLMGSALDRGVEIRISYGIGPGTDARGIISENTVEMLKKLFADRTNLKFHRSNTHIKLLICDDKYLMIGSYNFLSFDGKYDAGEERDEGMEYVVDKSLIRAHRQKRFSW